MCVLAVYMLIYRWCKSKQLQEIGATEHSTSQLQQTLLSIRQRVEVSTAQPATPATCNKAFSLR